MQLASRFSLQPELLFQPFLYSSIIFLNPPHPPHAQPTPFVHIQINFFLHNVHSSFHCSELGLQRKDDSEVTLKEQKLLGFIFIPCLEDQSVEDFSTGPVRSCLRS